MCVLSQRCERLLELHPVVYVHAVGRKCIPVAVNVAQQLKEDSRVAASSGGGESKVLKVESYSQAVDIRGEAHCHDQISNQKGPKRGRLSLFLFCFNPDILLC